MRSLLFFSAVSSFWILDIPASQAAVWYVNDTSTVGDSYTAAVGADTQSGTAAAPFRTIIKALNAAFSNDTIYVDRGIFDSYMTVSATETAGIKIDTDYISIIGMDSNATVIDPPGVNSVSGLYGIYADTQVGLFIKNIGVMGARDGFEFVNVDFSTVTGDSASSCGFNGIYLLNGSDTNTVSNSTFNSNSGQAGIFLSSSSGNAVNGNTTNSNSSGIYVISGSNNNTVNGNTVNSNNYGIYLDGSSNNTVSSNTASLNANHGVYLSSSSNNNTVSGNTTDTNSSNGIYLTSSSSNTADNNMANSNTGILANIKYSPYRLGPVDTVAADSAAPLPPQNITVSTAIANALRLTWTNPTLDEDSTPLTGFGAVNVYRLVNSPDTTHWANGLYAKVTGGATQFIDSNVTVGNTYYYRLTSDDTHPIVNTSFFSDTRSGAPKASNGDTLTIVSGNHQVIGGSGPAVLEVKVTDSAGQDVAKASVDFTVQYDGAAAASLNASATETGYLRQSMSLTSGDGLYVITASIQTGAADDVVFAVYTDKRRVPVHPTESPKSKWVMIAPIKKPDASLTGLNQVSYSGAPISYSYSAADDAGEPWYGYTSVTNQPAAENVSPRGTFSAYESGKGYWFRSSQATSVGLAGTPTAITDTFSVKLMVGANMIGSPFPFMIDWLDDVAVDTNLNDTPGPILLRNLTPAQVTATIDTRLQWRDQSAEQYVSPFASSETSVQMKPWAGFWVKVNASSCSIVYYPNKRMPQSAAVRQQAPVYQESKGDGSSWRMRLMAHSSVSEIRDEYTFIGVAPGAQDGEDINDLWKAPGMFGDLQVWVGEAKTNSGNASNAGNEPLAMKYYGASIASPIKTAAAWPVRVTGPTGAVTLSWDASGLPAGYGAFLLGGPNGPVDMVQNSSVSLALASAANLTLVAGSPEFLAAYLAAPLTKDMTFVYPNPGPDAAGTMTFKYNLPAAADVKLKIFDVGGKLVKEMPGTGAAGSNTLLWDTTNKHGQKLGSGVYIYILESGGNKLVDKCAIVR